jgi:D-3-phosphoglycerate dehydrogenase / 2-oxoglutarate reductase
VPVIRSAGEDEAPTALASQSVTSSASGDGDGVILVLGPFPESEREELAAVGKVVVIETTAPADQDIAPYLPHVTAVIARGSAIVSRDIIERAGRLRVIGRTGVGFDRIDVTAATERGIPVVITKNTGAVAVAEGALALAFALAKQLFELDRIVRTGRWAQRDHSIVQDLTGATIGVIGLGRIGREMARMSLGLDMRVLAYDPFVAAGDVPDGVVMCELDVLLGSSEFVSLHVPLTEPTRGMLGRREFDLIRPGAMVINVARGEVIDLDAMYAALQEGRVAGAALDTFEREPPELTHPIYRDPRVILTPHRVGLSVHALKGIFHDVTRQVIRVLEGQPPAADCVVNGEIYASETSETS